MDTKERMEGLARTMASAMALKSAGGKPELGKALSVPINQPRAIVAGWPQAPPHVAEQLLATSGAPNEPRPPSCSGTATVPGAEP